MYCIRLLKDLLTNRLFDSLSKVYDNSDKYILVCPCITLRLLFDLGILFYLTLIWCIAEPMRSLRERNKWRRTSIRLFFSFPPEIVTNYIIACHIKWYASPEVCLIIRRLLLWKHRETRPNKDYHGYIWKRIRKHDELLGIFFYHIF